MVLKELFIDIFIYTFRVIDLTKTVKLQSNRHFPGRNGLFLWKDWTFGLISRSVSEKSEHWGSPIHLLNGSLIRYLSRGIWSKVFLLKEKWIIITLVTFIHSSSRQKRKALRLLHQIPSEKRPRTGVIHSVLIKRHANVIIWF